MENSQGNCAKPPTSRTIEGTAVAMTVESIATRAVASMTAARIGPRSDRSPTEFEVGTLPCFPGRRPATHPASERGRHYGNARPICPPRAAQSWCRGGQDHGYDEA